MISWPLYKLTLGSDLDDDFMLYGKRIAFFVFSYIIIHGAVGDCLLGYKI